MLLTFDDRNVNKSFFDGMKNLVGVYIVYFS
jgi:hypothetical protein